MNVSKVRAGRYSAQVKSGAYTIKNVGSKKWLVINNKGRLVFKAETLGACEAWLDSLTARPASARSKNYLRALLSQQTGSPLAEQIRGYFNGLRSANALITQADVTRAINRLTTPAARDLVPAQRESVGEVLPKAVAIANARSAVKAAQSR